MAGQVGSAMVSEITSRAVSKVIGMVNKQGSVSEKLRKLERLCTEINSAEEASEHKITGTYLLKWQERLRKAGKEGGDVLFGFRWRTLNEASKSSNHQIGAPSPLTYTKIAVSNIVNYFHNAVKKLLSSNMDLQKLNSTVEMSEKQSADNED